MHDKIRFMEYDSIKYSIYIPIESKQHENLMLFSINFTINFPELILKLKGRVIKYLFRSICPRVDHIK